MPNFDSLIVQAGGDAWTATPGWSGNGGYGGQVIYTANEALAVGSYPIVVGIRNLAASSFNGRTANSSPRAGGVSGNQFGTGYGYPGTNGVTSDITGVLTWYGSSGGGAAMGGDDAYAGGAGGAGAGNGGPNLGGNPQYGGAASNYGCGSGGSCSPLANPWGKEGVVYIAYPGTSASCTGGTISFITRNGQPWVLHTFTADGTFTIVNTPIATTASFGFSTKGSLLPTFATRAGIRFSGTLADLRLTRPLAASTRVRVSTAAMLRPTSIAFKSSSHVHFNVSRSTLTIPPHGIFAVVEAELHGFFGGWTDITEDVRGDIVGSRGMAGNSPLQRVAKIGTMSIDLDNSENNSEKKLGLYTLEHPNCRAGFVEGCGIRFSISIDATIITQFTGRLEKVTAATDIHGSRISSITVVDYMHETSKKRLSSLVMQRDIPEGEAFSQIIDAIPLQPRAIEIGRGPDTLPYMFDTIKDDRTTPMAELVRLSNSTLAYIYVKMNGTLAYEPRSVRAVTFQSAVTLTPGDYQSNNPPDVTDTRSTQINRVTATIHPRAVSVDETVILYEIEAPFTMKPNAELLIRGYYTDEGLKTRRAGGLDMLPAEPVIDYVFNTERDGTGLDVTAQATVDTIFTANSVLFTINVPVDCWCIKLQSRGTKVIDNSNMSVEAANLEQIDLRGEQGLALDMPYNADPAFGQEVVQYLLFLAQTTSKRVNTVPILLNVMDRRRSQLLARRDLSERITMVEPMTALNMAFFINAINFTYTVERLYTITWVPTLADATNYWFLEIPGFTELGYTTRLGFGLIIGHTDLAHNDFHFDALHSDIVHDDTHADITHADAEHSDVAHSDVPHQDTPHTDVSHNDQHLDSGHIDNGAHADSHGDSPHTNAHGDQPHADQSHGDIPYHGYTNSHDDNAHGDAHTDMPHGDHNFHTDSINGGTHSDVPHQDSHTNNIYGDSHIDDGGNPHVDQPHYDGAHTNSHTDNAHNDSHGDIPHQDAAHGDNHLDSPHTNINHNDLHTDQGHGDAAHGDVIHTDDHTDVPHSDQLHQDSHGDTAHGDIN